MIALSFWISYIAYPGLLILYPLIADNDVNSTLTNVGSGVAGAGLTALSAIAVFLRELSNQRDTFRKVLIKQVVTQRKSNVRLGKQFRSALEEFHGDSMKQGEAILEALQTLAKIRNKNEHRSSPGETPRPDSVPGASESH